MIQVQIARQITADGVDGVRWVLVDSGDDDRLGAPSPTPEAAAPAGALPDDGADGRPGRSSALPLTLLKLLVVALGMALAVWLATSAHGPVRIRWLAPTSDALPAPATPAPAASSARPLVTAELH